MTTTAVFQEPIKDASPSAGSRMIGRRSRALAGCSFDTQSILRRRWETPRAFQMHLHCSQVSYLLAWKVFFFSYTSECNQRNFTSWAGRHKMSLAVIFHRFPLRELSLRPIWGSDAELLPAPGVCVRVRVWLLYLNAFLQGKEKKKKRPRACVHPLNVPCPAPLTELAAQIDAAEGFWVICSSSVTVMRAKHKDGGGAVNVSVSARTDTEHLSGARPSHLPSTQCAHTHTHTHVHAHTRQGSDWYKQESTEDGSTKALIRREGGTSLVAPARGNIEKL